MMFSSSTKALPSSLGSSKKRDRIDGTCTKAKQDSSSSPFKRTAIFRLLLASNGKGRLSSTASGVKTGNNTLSK